LAIDGLSPVRVSVTFYEDDFLGLLSKIPCKPTGGQMSNLPNNNKQQNLKLWEFSNMDGIGLGK
jgi:hypothetical protein